MSASAWSTIASLATAVGTLVLALGRGVSRHWNIDRPYPR
jgi:hypothetical protein